jgi:hypothetical protein
MQVVHSLFRRPNSNVLRFNLSDGIGQAIDDDLLPTIVAKADWRTISLTE